jgi:hypothetical protein
MSQNTHKGMTGHRRPVNQKMVQKNALTHKLFLIF